MVPCVRVAVVMWVVAAGVAVAVVGVLVTLTLLRCLHR